MPKPEFSTRPSRTSKSKGISGWIQGRKERKKALAEQTAKIITDDTAKNETAIIDTLSSIDFIHSRLPEEVLEAKSNPNRPCGDLEYASKAICRMLLKNPQTLSLDLRKLDEKLLTISMLFKQSIEQGDKRAAFAAKAALVRGINDIRTRIPANSPELFNQFIEANAKYLDSWITLIGLAQVADRVEQNAEEQKALLISKEEKHKKALEQLKSIIQEDSVKAEIFADIVNHDTPEERAKWTQEQRDMHKLLIEKRMDGVILQLDRLLLQQKETDLASKESQIETLYSKVASQEIVADPNLMNKFREEVDKMFEELAASDAELDETLRLMDDIEGRIAQMDKAPGAVRAQEVVAEEGKAAIEEIKRMQDIEIGNQAKRTDEKLKSLGILSKEDEATLKRQAEEAQQKAMEEMLNAAFDSSEEGQGEREELYN